MSGRENEKFRGEESGSTSGLGRVNPPVTPALPSRGENRRERRGRGKDVSGNRKGEGKTDTVNLDLI